MIYEKIQEPEPSAQDVLSIRKFSPFINELTISKTNNVEYKASNYQPKKEHTFKSKYQIAKELKAVRESIFTNIQLDDLPYTRFLTLNKASYMTLSDVQKAWNGFKNGLEKDLGRFNSFAVFEHSQSNGYHIHALISDPLHQKQFEWLDYRLISNNWYGNNKVTKIRNLEHLVSTAFYITKLRNKENNTHFDFIGLDQSLVDVDGEIKDVPAYLPFDSYEITNMKEYLSNSYRMNSGEFSKVFTRKLYVKNHATA